MNFVINLTELLKFERPY